MCRPKITAFKTLLYFLPKQGATGYSDHRQYGSITTLASGEIFERDFGAGNGYDTGMNIIAYTKGIPVVEQTDVVAIGGEPGGLGAAVMAASVAAAEGKKPFEIDGTIVRAALKANDAHL